MPLLSKHQKWNSIFLRPPLSCANVFYKTRLLIITACIENPMKVRLTPLCVCGVSEVTVLSHWRLHQMVSTKVFRRTEGLPKIFTFLHAGSCSAPMWTTSPEPTYIQKASRWCSLGAWQPWCLAAMFHPRSLVTLSSWLRCFQGLLERLGKCWWMCVDVGSVREGFGSAIGRFADRLMRRLTRYIYITA